jgi:rubredoxin
MVAKPLIRLKFDFNSIHCLHIMAATDAQVYKTYMCLICGFIYDEAAGLPEEGIEPGTRWEDVPMNWTCPECGARKEDFEIVEI